MNHKRIADNLIKGLPTKIENIQMSYLNRVIGEKTKSQHDFAEIKRIIVNDHIKKKSTNETSKTYKNYLKN